MKSMVTSVLCLLILPLGGAPTLLIPAWSAVGEEGNSAFGMRAMTVGDVNRDGYDDLIVGAPQWHSNRGKAYVYYGSRKGLGPKAAWTAQGESAEESFADRVGQAGDLNGDGIADFFVAAPRWKNGLGRTLLYYGSKRGPAKKANWSVSPEHPGEIFGDCTHPTGDLDGDGVDDLAVGAFGADENRGRILVYKGSKAGLGQKPIWEARGEAPRDWYGYGLAGAGDVNGDGFDDLLAGAKYNDAAGQDAGKAYLYFGHASGPSLKPDWTWMGPRPEALASMRVTSAGDVNGDGFGDVMVTAPGAKGDLGWVVIFLGAKKGLSKKPDLLIKGPDFGLEFFGQGACPVGDIDGDGFDDIAIGGRDSHGRGVVLVFRGQSTGMANGASWQIDGEGQADRFAWWLAPAGDLDGDGRPDLVISAESAGAGKVYVVYGRQCGPIAAVKAGGKGIMHGYLWKSKR